MLNSGFLNKNTLRRYPLRAGHTQDIPNALIAGIRVTIPDTYVDAGIAIVKCQDRDLRVFLNAKDRDTDTYVVLGCFGGLINQSYQVLKLTALSNLCSGFLVTGTIEAMNEYQGLHIYSDGSLLLEPTVVNFYTRPALYSITTNNVKYTGMVTMISDNINFVSISTTSNFKLVVKDPTTVESKADINNLQLKCGLPLISSINGMTPKNGNIDLYTLNPLRLTINYSTVTFVDSPGKGAGGAELQTVAGGATLKLSSFCDKSAIPSLLTLSRTGSSEGYTSAKYNSSKYDTVANVVTPIWKKWLTIS